MSTASHSGGVCCLADQTCPQFHTADMSAAAHSRHVCCVTQKTCRLHHTAESPNKAITFVSPPRTTKIGIYVIMLFVVGHYPMHFGKCVHQSRFSALRKQCPPAPRCIKKKQPVACLAERDYIGRFGVQHQHVSVLQSTFEKIDPLEQTNATIMVFLFAALVSVFCHFYLGIFVDLCILFALPQYALP